MTAILKILLITSLVREQLSSNKCPASHQTMKYQGSCPKTSTEWQERSKIRNCNQTNQNCTQRENFQYHCLINEYLNATVEVCAPVTNILGRKCAEYNVIGTRIQDSAELDCSDCPFMYQSNMAHKYQKCYDVIKSSQNGIYSIKYNRTYAKNGRYCKEENSKWFIGAVVSIILNISFVGVCVFLLLLKKNRTGKPDRIQQGTSSEHEELLSKTGSFNDTLEKSTRMNKSNIRVAAIQLDDRYCGFAFSKGDDPAQVQEGPTGALPKTTTRLLLHEGEVNFYGYDAREEYIKVCRDGKEEKYTYFDDLMINKEESELYVTDSRGNKHKAKTIYKEFIKSVVDHAKRQFEHDADSSGTTTLFIFTVPDSWEEEKKLMIETIIKETPNIDNRESTYMLDASLAVSPYLHEVKEEVLCHNFNVDNLSFSPGTTYAILDIGTYSCEINLMTVCQKDHSKDIIKEKKSVHWDNSPEQWLVSLLVKLFGNVAIDSIRKDLPGDYFSVMLNFETWKDNVNLTDSDIKILIPSTFRKKVTYYNESKLPKLVKIFAGKTDSVSEQLENGNHTLTVNKKLAMECFSGLISQTSTLVNEHILERRDVKCVCMTGVYAKYNIVQKAMKECFYRRTVTIPSIPDLVVAKGAAYYGYKQLDKMSNSI